MEAHEIAVLQERLVFPGEILEEILLRVCARDVIRFKTVCKAWLDMISSPNFIRLHLNTTTDIHHRLALINPRTKSRNNDTLDLLVWHIDQRGTATIKKRADHHEEAVGGTFSPRVIGSCDGLICYLDGKFHHSSQESIITIWNPTTGQSLRIPTKFDIEEGHAICFGFGRKNVGNRNNNCDNFCVSDYKLVVGTSTHAGSDCLAMMHSIRPFDDPCEWKPSLFSSSENADQGSFLIKRGLFFIEQERGTLFKGVLHWPAGYNDGLIHDDAVLVAYDLEQETLREVSKLPGQEFQPFTLGELHGCLTAMTCSSFGWELWIMKEYGMKESWSKLMILPRGVPYVECESPLHFLWACEDGDYIFGTEGPYFGLYKIRVNYQHTVFYQDLPGYRNVRVIPYVETLFWPQRMGSSTSTTSYSI